jgi:tRNA(Ile)-lysidine synthase
MHNLLHLDLLKSGKSLLAFSGGVDSSALFHLLLGNHINFDIAHVNYHSRASSDAEAQSALRLAQTHNKQCHLHSCHLQPTNFEHTAREERYAFFTSIMKEHGYAYLLTAHQLNDRLEWMLMQLTRGAGLPEMLGLSSHDQKGEMTILRPLLEWDRESIEHYLQVHLIPHHIDQSNHDEKYTRNRFRHQFANPLMSNYGDAIRRSFAYLDKDCSMLIEKVDFTQIDKFYYAPTSSSQRSDVFAIDKLLKTLGFVLNAHERTELLSKKELIVGRQWAVILDKKWMFIAPYVCDTVLEKKFKEVCRILKIHPKLRGFLGENSAAFEKIKALLAKPLTLPLYD